MSTSAPRDPHPDPLLSQAFPLDEAPGPASKLAVKQADLLIEGALDAWEFDRRQPARATAPAVSSWLPRLAAAAALIATVVTGAAAARYFLWSSADVATEPPPSEPPRARLARPNTPVLPAPVPEDPVAEPEPADPVQDARTPNRRAERVRQAQAEDLLARANALRGRSQWPDAERAYLEVSRRYPDTPSAYVAQVAAAALRLDKLDDAHGARRLYARALAARPQGNLTLEIRQGLARAARRLGDMAGEIVALTDIVERHPDTPAAAQARNRLEALSAH
jgi:tetratricopeptide (TPR) repeat protein